MVAVAGEGSVIRAMRRSHPGKVGCAKAAVMDIYEDRFASRVDASRRADAEARDV
jgi:hypothetical protein